MRGELFIGVFGVGGGQARRVSDQQSEVLLVRGRFGRAAISLGTSPPAQSVAWTRKPCTGSDRDVLRHKQTAQHSRGRLGWLDTKQRACQVATERHSGASNNDVAASTDGTRAVCEIYPINVQAPCARGLPDEPLWIRVHCRNAEGNGWNLAGTRAGLGHAGRGSCEEGSEVAVDTECRHAASQ